MKHLYRFVPFLIICILAYSIFRPLFIPGTFPIHDDTQVARVHQMTKALQDGHFPVRWVSDLGYGYGYPIFNFYAPLAYYIGGVFGLLGFTALQATKIMMGIGIAVSGFTMYLFAKELWGRSGGIVASALYLFAPYHAVNIYVRGDVAEYFAYALYPLVFFGFYKIFKSESGKDLAFWIPLSSFAYAFVVLSHNLSAFMFTPFLLLYIVFLMLQMQKERQKKAMQLLLGFTGGVLLSGFYWFPVLFELQYTNILSQIGGGADFRDHFVCLTQLWQSHWGFGGSVPGCVDGLSFMIGKIHIVLSLFAVLLFVLWKKRETVAHRHAPFFLFSAILAIFFSLSFSQIVWEVVPFMEFLQYPWRFIGIAVLFLSLLGGSVPVFLSRKTAIYARISIVLAIVAIIVFTNHDFFIPQTIHQKTNNDFINDYALKWTTSKISDEYMPYNFQKPVSQSEIVDEKIVVEDGKGIVTLISDTTDEVNAQIVTSEFVTVKLNTAYFPAWKLKVNGRDTAYQIRNDGLVVQLPPGEHQVSLRFVQTVVEKIGNGISAIGIVLLGIGIIYIRKRSLHDE